MITRYHILVLAIVLLCPVASAQWVRTNGPYSGNVTCLAVSGMNLFVGTFGGGVFLSTDNGTSWTAVNVGLMDLGVTALVVSGKSVLVGTFAHGVFRSTNSGAQWTPVNDGLPDGQVEALASTGKNLFAGVFYGPPPGTLYLSTNEGTNWTECNNGLPSTFLLCLCVSGGNVFAGTTNGVYRSTDDGVSWSSATLGVGDTYVMFVASSPKRAGGRNLFAGTLQKGVFLSTDDGLRWDAANEGLADTLGPVRANALAVVGTNLVVGTCYNWKGSVRAKGVFLSTNNGAQWTAINEGLPKATNWGDSTHYVDINNLVVFGQNLYAATKDGLWRCPLSELTTSVEGATTGPAITYSLMQNYPNPFNPSTTIRYGLSSRAHVSLTVYNTLGQQVSILQNGDQEAGYHEVTFDGANLPSGVYFYRLQAGDFTQTKRLVLVR